MVPTCCCASCDILDLHHLSSGLAFNRWVESRRANHSILTRVSRTGNSQFYARNCHFSAVDPLTIDLTSIVGASDFRHRGNPTPQGSTLPAALCSCHRGGDCRTHYSVLLLVLFIATSFTSLPSHRWLHGPLDGISRAGGLSNSEADKH